MMLLLGACSDSAAGGGGAGAAGGATGAGGTAPSGGSQANGGSGGAPACEPGLTSSFFSQHCVDCVEEACCPAAAACADDAECRACLDDTTTAGCDTNAAILDLLSCASSSSCVNACGCLDCGCVDDGVCDAGFMGFEVCSCSDCMTDPVPACQGACAIDGTCGNEDACTCDDCDGEDFCEGCNLDGFCDTYSEGCACADCAKDAACV